MDSYQPQEEQTSIRHLLVARAEEGEVGEPMGVGAPMVPEAPREGQEQTVAEMEARDGTQIMAARQEVVRLVADGHHKEVSGDAMEADTNRKHHHRSFSEGGKERLPLG